MRLTLRAPLSLLRVKENDLLMLLRLGAGMNALESSHRLLLKVGDGGSELDKLSRMHCVSTAFSYFAELVKTIKDNNYLDRLFELAAKGHKFSPIPFSLAEGREFLSPDNPDFGGSSLLKIRDKVAFHWDPQAFRHLLKSQDGTLDLWTVSGQPPDRMFTASANAILQLSPAGMNPQDRTDKDFMDLFSHAVIVVGHVHETAFIGLLIEAGETQPTKYFVWED